MITTATATTTAATKRTERKPVKCTQLVYTSVVCLSARPRLKMLLLTYTLSPRKLCRSSLSHALSVSITPLLDITFEASNAFLFHKSFHHRRFIPSIAVTSQLCCEFFCLLNTFFRFISPIH